MDIEALAEPFNELLDKAVMHHVSLGSLQETLSLPHIIRNMVTVYTQCQIILGNPEIRQNDVFILIIKRWKNKNKRSNICCRRKVKPAVADAPLKFVLINGECALVPFLHRHPTNRLLYPLVQAKLSESVLLARVLLCGIASGFDLIYSDRNVKARICLFPHFGVCPVVGFICAVNHGIKSRVDFPTRDYILCLLVSFIANAVSVSSCGSD